jgi:hypothetical protein
MCQLFWTQLGTPAVHGTIGCESRGITTRRYGFFLAFCIGHSLNVFCKVLLLFCGTSVENDRLVFSIVSLSVIHFHVIPTS